MLIDAFLYDGEVDILNLRIEELSPVVDKFVIVESLERHGSPNRKLLPSILVGYGAGDKIHYVCLDHLEPAFDGTNSWARENYHRNCLMRHIVEASGSSRDVLMLSDADEIPRAESLTGLSCDREQLHGTAQDFFYYNVNTYGGEWHGTVIGTIDAFYHAGGLQAARNKRDGLGIIPNCGWHFSWAGGLNRVLSKVKNFAHAHEDSSKSIARSPVEDIAKDLLSGIDIYHRPEMKFEHRSSDDPRLPRYFLENKERFPQFTEEGFSELVKRELSELRNM
jgi:hypothetical protein